MPIPSSPRLILTAVIALTAAIYWTGLYGGYVFDDFPNIVYNEQTRMMSLAPEQWLRVALAGEAGPLGRPLSMISFALERYLFGLDPFPMKLTNLLIHLVNTSLIYLLGLCVLRRIQTLEPGQPPRVVSVETLALFTATAWAVAPINLTAVLFVVQRMESLATLFILAGVLAYFRGRMLLEMDKSRSGWSWILGGFIIGGGLGVLAKESAVMLPVYTLLVEWLLFDFAQGRPVVRRQLLWLYGVVLALPAVAGLALYLPGLLSGTSYENRPFTLNERLLTETRVLWNYLWWSVAPAPGQLSLYHDAITVSRSLLQPWTTLLATLGLAGLLCSAALLHRRFRLVAFGLLWFFVMHLLVSTALNLELVYEHRNYLGSFGIYLALFFVIFSGKSGDSLRFARRTLAIGLIVLYGLLTFLRAEEWSDPLRLAQLEANRQQESARANYELGRALAVIAPGPDSPLFTQAMKTFEQTATLPQAGLLPYQALIFMKAKHGFPVDPAWWIGMYKYIATHPLSAQDAGALYSLVKAQIDGIIQTDTTQLDHLLETAIKHNPRHPKLLALRANFLLNVTRDFAQAESLLQQAVTLAPKNAQLWINLAQFQLATGQTAAARASLERLAELNRFGRLDASLRELRAISPSSNSLPLDAG